MSHNPDSIDLRLSDEYLRSVQPTVRHKSFAANLDPGTLLPRGEATPLPTRAPAPTPRDRPYHYMIESNFNRWRAVHGLGHQSRRKCVGAARIDYFGIQKHVIASHDTTFCDRRESLLHFQCHLTDRPPSSMASRLQLSPIQR